MVTPIKYFKKDPNNLNRGVGAYYHRGHGYYSKYSLQRDKNRLSTGWKVDVVGLPKATKWPQIGDGIINRGKYDKRVKPKQIGRK